MAAKENEEKKTRKKAAEDTAEPQAENAAPE